MLNNRGCDIIIEDDFDLGKISSSGQCFRSREFPDGRFRFIAGERVLYISSLKESRHYHVSCSADEWENFWMDYFDLSRDYKSIRDSIKTQNEFDREAVRYGSGIRILRQEPWEMLVSFIISQRKSIPAIKTVIEKLAKTAGKPIQTDCEVIYTFPSPKQLLSLSEEELAACGLGYRSGYVRDAAERVASGETDLADIAVYDDKGLFDELVKVRGVGKKVANCICLFGYGRLSMVPEDVWILRAIDEDFNGCNPFPAYGKEAGLVQQYIFYYKKHKGV